MIEIHLLGQFELHLDGKPVEIPSRPAQSLLSYLALTAGTTHRRERLAGLIWPDIPDADARRNLRRALWHIRKATQGHPPLRADDINIAFEAGQDVQVDALLLTKKLSPERTVEELVQVVSVYRGELLPGFYDEWIIVERERLHAVFEARIKLLLDRLIEGRYWDEVIELGEKWISLSWATEPAYRALMVAYSGLGDLSGVAQTYQRCVVALSRDLGVEPAEETHQLFEQLSQKRHLHTSADANQHDQHQSVKSTSAETTKAPTQIPALGEPSTSMIMDERPPEPPFKGLQFFDEGDAGLFFGREELTAQLLQFLGIGQGVLSDGKDLLVIVGASGSGKSSLVRAGLVPAIRRSNLPEGQLNSEQSGARAITVLTPTAHPSRS